MNSAGGSGNRPDCPPQKASAHLQIQLQVSDTLLRSGPVIEQTFKQNCIGNGITDIRKIIKEKDTFLFWPPACRVKMINTSKTTSSL
jgi:hypothetical protein